MSLAAQSSPLLSRIMSSSVAIANQAGTIIREIMKKGELGIVEKEVSQCGKTLKGRQITYSTVIT